MKKKFFILTTALILVSATSVFAGSGRNGGYCGNYESNITYNSAVPSNMNYRVHSEDFEHMFYKNGNCIFEDYCLNGTGGY